MRDMAVFLGFFFVFFILLLLFSGRRFLRIMCVMSFARGKLDAVVWFLIHLIRSGFVYTRGKEGKGVRWICELFRHLALFYKGIFFFYVYKKCIKFCAGYQLGLRFV